MTPLLRNKPGGIDKQFPAAAQTEGQCPASIYFWPGVQRTPTRMQRIRGKPGKNPREKARFLPWVFSGFLRPEAHVFRSPRQQAEVVCSIKQVFSPIGVQRGNPSGAGLGPRRPQEKIICEQPLIFDKNSAKTCIFLAPLPDSWYNLPNKKSVKGRIYACSRSSSRNSRTLPSRAT